MKHIEIHIKNPPKWAVEIQLRDASLSISNTDFETAKIVANEIVKDCNNYNALVEALRWAQSKINYLDTITEKQALSVDDPGYKLMEKLLSQTEKDGE